MFNNFEWLQVLTWNGTKRFLFLIFISVLFYFIFPPHDVFDEIKTSSWHSDFYFILYWLFACSASLCFIALTGFLLFEAPFFVNPKKLRAICAVFTKEEKTLLKQGKDNEHIIRFKDDDTATTILEELRIIQKITKNGESQLWKVTMYGRNFYSYL